MATLTPVVTTRAGAVVGGATPTITVGDKFLNTGREVAIISNASGSGITVTEDIKTTIDGAAVTDPAVAIAAGAIKVLGPWPTDLYNDSDGYMKLTCSAVATVSIYIVRVPGL